MTDRELLAIFEKYAPQHGNSEDINNAIEALRARLAQPWVKTYSGGKPNYTQPEQVAQFKFQEYGPPNWGESQVTTPEFVAEQEAMNEALRKRVMDGIPDMPIKVQDEREANYKSFAQSAQVLGITEPEPVAWTTDLEFDYDTEIIPAKEKGRLGTSMNDIPLYTAPPKKEWVDLSKDEIENCFEMSMFGTCRAIEAKLKEKNNG